MPFSRSPRRPGRSPAVSTLLAIFLAACSASLAIACDPDPRTPSAAKPKDTPPPPPDIRPDEARKYVGKQVRATLFIRKTKKSDETKRTYLDSELDYKDPKNLGILIEDADLPNFTKAGISKPHVHYKDQTIRVIGKPFLEDETIFIKVERPAQIEVIKPAEKR